LPTVYDVTDFWLAEGLREDPWLAWWNRPRGSFLSRFWRAALEGAGKRNALDATAPTRMMQGYERMPELYDNPAPIPEAVAGFRFDRIFFCSEALKSAAVQGGFRVAHGEVIYPGIDTQVYVGEVKPPGAGIQKLLWVGHLDARSGATTAVRALQQAREENLRASLSIYGRGDSGYVAELRSYIAMHSLPVEFLPVSNLVRDLPQVYRRHDVLVHTTEWGEPFSLIPLEAMASGLPVVGAAVGGVRELFRHGENALTYTPGDAAELAYCLRELQRDPAMRTRMAETAQQEVLSNYNETAVMDRIENYLNTSLEVWSHAAS
jgi:glycosyltransferase involved in cell wall biosynthesis